MGSFEVSCFVRSRIKNRVQAVLKKSRGNEFFSMRDMSNYSKEHWDEDIRRFAEEWGEVLCKAILKMADGVHDKDVDDLKEEYGEELFDKIERLVTGNLEDEEVRLFIDELGREFYDDIINLVKKRAASRERLPGTPYKSDMSNYSKEHWDEDTRRFAEDWSEFLCKAIIKMIDGVYDKDVENFKEEYGEVFGKIKRLVTGNLEDEEVRLFIDELGRGFYDDINNLVKKRAASRERLPGTPYKKGDFIGQKYEVYDVLGMGGFGVVYLVYSHESAKFVFALKTFRDEYLEDAQTRERFKKEAQVWIDMERHPYLVRAHFVDNIVDRLFIGIEYIAPDEEGLNSLDGYLKRRPPDLAQSLRWGIQFCHGMEYAYSRGIRAHRDIKPANIMIGQGKILKITDFGLAGIIGNARISGIKLDIQNNKVGFSCQTMEGSGFGTPTYMPPEQFTNAAACDERSDIYSFGIVLYQMATGGSFPFLPKLPKNEGFWQDMYRLHCQATVPKLNSPLFPIIQRCLEKEPNRRYRSFKDLRADLEPLLKQLTGEVIKLPERREFDAWEWTNKGASLGNLGKYQEAVACCDKALKINPRHAGAWNNKGNALHSLGKYQEAIACCDKVLEINPRDAWEWSNKGASLINLGKYQEAIACCDKALKINPRHAGAWNNKGRSLQSLGKHQESIACYDKALEINPRETKTWINKGSALSNLDKFHEAISCYNKALEINPRNTEAWYNKGNHLFKLGKYQEAIACYDKVLEINPRDADSWRNKGAVLSELGKHQEAIDCFGNAIEINPHSDQVAKINGIIEGLKAKVRNMGSNKEDWTLVNELSDMKVYVDCASVQRNGSQVMAKVIYISNPPGKDRNGKPIKEIIMQEEHDTSTGRSMIHQIVLNYTDGTSLSLLTEPKWHEATDESLKILHFLRSLGTKNTESPKTKWWQFWKG